MNTRVLLLSLAVAAGAAAGFHHWKTQHAQARMAMEVVRLQAEAAETRRLTDDTFRQVADARDELQALLAAHANRSVSHAPAATGASPADGTPSPKKVATAPSEELRRLQVQAFVSNQRLRFGALLKRLGFTPEQLQKFDRIHAAYQYALLESPQPEGARQLALETRDAALLELFGAASDQWIAANREQPARAIVEQIVQQTFQGSGALTASQADELTHIVAQHRLPPSKETDPASASYDWNQIIAAARSILADRQMEDFVTAIDFRRTVEKMAALAAKKKS